MGLIPGWRTKIPHAKGQLSLSAAARESPSATTKTQGSPTPKMPPEPPSLLEEEEKAEKNIAVIENNTIISVRQMKQIKYSGIYTFFFLPYK